MEKENIKLKGDEPLRDWIERSLDEYIPEKPSYTKEDLITAATIIFGSFEINGEIYCGFTGLIEHKRGILLAKAMEIAAKHHKMGNELLSIPEFAEADKKIHEFNNFIRKYFGYDPRELKFINENENQ